MPEGRRRQPGLGVMLLFYQIFGVIGIDNITPVTLGIVGLHVAVFLRLFTLPWYNASQVCVSAYRVWQKKEYMRLVYAAFEHGDDWHLYYNMVSFALKGRSLERRFGSVKFLYIVSVFTVLTNAVLVAISVFASKYNSAFGNQCAIGFSGVIFALKVLTTSYGPDDHSQRIMGIPISVPSGYAVWFELILIQLFIPKASFFGHLAGILVGVAYVKGPLKPIMDLVYSIATSVISPQPPQPPRPRFERRAEATGYSGEHYTEFIPPGMSEEEQLRQAMAASLNNSTPRYNNVPPYPTYSGQGNSSPPPAGFTTHYNGAQSSPPPPGFAPDIEELRHKRQVHFTN